MNTHAPVTVTPAHPRIVIIGGGYAGLYCALRLARRSRSGTEIHLVNPRARFTERIRLHEQASGHNLREISIPALVKGLPIHFHAAAATSIDRHARRVVLNNGTTLAYDRLVYALGSRINRTLPGAEEHALALENLDEASEIAMRVEKLAPGSKVMVVGGGLTGTELVFEMAERFPHVQWTLVTREAYAQGYAPGARSYFIEAMAQRNITLRTGISVQEVTAGHLGTDQGELPFDLCLWAGSFRGYPLGRAAGLAVNELDQVKVDATLRSITDPNIYAIGDGAALPAEFAPTLVMGCKTASPLGLHAAENLAADLRGAAVRPFWFRYLITCVSIGRHDGLIQVLGGDGQSAQRFITGKLGARIKEFVCRSTVTALYLERNLSLVARRRPTRTPRATQPMPEPQPAEESTIAHGHRI